MIAGARFKRERMAVAASDELIAATDLADLLVKRGTPFREAHGVIAGLVREAVSSGRSLADVAVPALGDDAAPVLGQSSWLESKVSEGGGAAVLIRALEPLEGIELMRERRGLDRLQDLCSGPGKLSQALGIELELNGTDLAAGPIVIEPRLEAWRDVRWVAGERVGISKAVDLEWRFCALGSRSVSRPWPRELRAAPASA